MGKENPPGGSLRPGGWLWELLGDLGSLLSHPVFVLTMLGATAYIGETLTHRSQLAWPETSLRSVSRWALLPTLAR